MGRGRTALLLACVVVAGCGDDTVEGPPPAAPATIRLTSAAFEDGGTIPQRFTCDGDDVSPPLSWSGVPGGAKALALVMEDPDAPDGTFVHWILLDIPPRETALAAGDAPSEATAVANSFGDRRYGGPCPPKGDEPHRYRFLLYALKAPLRLDEDVTAADARSAIGDQALASGRLTGRFGR
jgi:Raf kinase inhibitor-like YbhB/YbcL family protein